LHDLHFIHRRDAVTVLVVGAGATGGYFGAELHRAGRDVTFLVRPARAAQLRERGLRIVGDGETTAIDPELVTAQEIATTWDVVLLTVKATALEPAIADFAPAVGPDTAIIPILNGMSHLDILNARFGESRVLGGVAKLATQLDSAGDIAQLAPGASLDIGRQDGRTTDRLSRVGRELDVPAFELTVRDDIVAAMWQKWVFIATIGATTSLMRAPIGDIVAVPGGRDLGPAILAEAAAASEAARYPVPAQQLAGIESAVTAEGSTLTSSLSRDVAENRHTEVEAVLGDLARRAAALGVKTPLLDLTTMQLRVHETKLNARPK
jgi:2-dehydropantoate 2-reductase